ncbi:hypothetical protein, variant [Exophiala mesophila]|nr:hypothetical protein, variant [Exophiala mesophila]KIV93221.1 hypothetical protein, variant [Exophiala mesophila]
MMMKYLEVGTSGMVTASTATSEDELSEVLADQLDTTRAPMGLWPEYSAEHRPVQFVHDRWPRISFTLPDIVSFTVQWIVQDGCIFQQYIVESHAEEELIAVCFRVHMNINLLPTSHFRIPYGAYKLDPKPLEPHPNRLSVQRKVVAEPNSDSKPPCLGIGELVLSFALFEDGKALKTNFGPDNSFEYWLELGKNQKRELMAKYHLGAKESKIEPAIDIQTYFDVSEFLKRESELYGTWRRNPNLECHFILRRTLEHILSVCAVPMARDGEKSELIAITDGEMLDPMHLMSSPFRFLTRMSQLLRDDTEHDIADKKLKDYLQARIKKTCIGALKWCFEYTDVETNDGGWSSGYYLITGKKAPGEPGQSHLILEFIEALHELIRAFPEEQTFVVDKLQQKHVIGWLTKLHKERHISSGIWFNKEKNHLIDWYDHDYNDSNEINFPYFKLKTLICLWRSLRFLQKVCETRKSESTMTKGVSGVPKSAESTQKSNLPTTILDTDARSISSQIGDGTHSKVKDTVVPDLLDELNKKMHEPMQNDRRKEINNCLRILDPVDIRSRIIDRFTFVPQISKSKLDPRADKDTMIAVCRSARSVRTRFHFHQDDCRLFEAVAWGFFHDKSGALLPAWERTLKAQDKIDTGWDSPARYVIAISQIDYELSDIQSNAVAESGKDLVDARDDALSGGNQKGLPQLAPEQDQGSTGTSTDAMLLKEKARREELRRVLLGLALSSGLFAHCLDDSGMPDREIYPFRPGRRYETAYYLLASDFKGRLPKIERIIMSSSDKVEAETDDKQTTSGIKVEISEEKLKARRRIRKARDSTTSQILEAGRGRIVKYDETDWLYKELPCFRGEDKMDIRDEKSPLSDEMLPSVLRAELKALRKSTATNTEENKTPWEGSVKTFVIDVKRNMNGKPVSNPIDMWNPSTMWNHSGLDDFLRRERTRRAAKKRLIILPSPTKCSLLLVYAHCPISEQSSMARFLDRHEKFSNVATKVTSRLANMWMTELHLSFLKLLPLSESDQEDTSGNKFVQHPLIHRLNGQSKAHFLYRATRSFRTVGDMYDKSWTCWILCANPGETGSSQSNHGHFPSHPEGPWGEWINPVLEKTEFHSQRKVFEIRLFTKFAKQALANTDEALRTVDEYMKDQVVNFPAGMSTSSFVTGNKRNLKMYSQLIIVLRELQRNSEAINNTTKDWGLEFSEKPRWTESDEAKYGSKLGQEYERNRRAIEDLAEQKENIKARITEVELAQERAMSEFSVNLAISQNRTDAHVQLFTYATVVFLPLGFSSSLFSMGGPPSKPTILAFVVTVVVVGVVTAMSLMNAQIIAWVVTRPLKFFINSTQGKMEKSRGSFWKSKVDALKRRRDGYLQTHILEKGAENDQAKNSQVPRPEEEETRPTKLWYVGFWFWYIGQPIWFIGRLIWYIGLIVSWWLSLLARRIWLWLRKSWYYFVISLSRGQDKKGKNNDDNGSPSAAEASESTDSAAFTQKNDLETQVETKVPSNNSGVPQSTRPQKESDLEAQVLVD